MGEINWGSLLGGLGQGLGSSGVTGLLNTGGNLWNMFNTMNLQKKQMGLMNKQWDAQKKVYDEDMADRNFRKHMKI